MTMKISRRRIARYVAGQLLSDGDTNLLLKQLAGFLIDSSRVNELDHIVRDIEIELAKNGYLVARVTSARGLSEALKGAIKQQLMESEKVSQVDLTENIDESVIAGVRIDTPDKRLDGTVSKKLAILRSNYKR